MTVENFFSRSWFVLHRLNPFGGNYQNDIERDVADLTNPELKSQLNEILYKLQEQSEDLDKIAKIIEDIQRLYSEEINSYLYNIQPLVYTNEEWEKLTTEKDFFDECLLREKDFYWLLIKYGIITNNLDLLTYWGINHTFGGQSGARPIMKQEKLKEYLINILYDDSDEGLIAALGEKSRVYAEHLISFL